jgi:hypothetical protein
LVGQARLDLLATGTLIRSRRKEAFLSLCISYMMAERTIAYLQSLSESPGNPRFMEITVITIMAIMVSRQGV